MGRSNVGKSSLINALCQRKDLAKSSSTPGKTRLINFFEVEFKKLEERYKMIFIDVPGFGYASVSKQEKEAWGKELGEFLKKRETIKLFLHLKDSRLPPQAIDLKAEEFVRSFLRGDQRYFSVFTKLDKLNQSELSALKKREKDAFLVSIKNEAQIEQLREKIVELAFMG